MEASHNLRFRLQKVKGGAVNLSQCPQEEDEKAQRLEQNKGYILGLNNLIH